MTLEICCKITTIFPYGDDLSCTSYAPCPGFCYEPLTGAVDGVNAHSRRAETLRYAMLPLQGIDNPEGVL